MSSENPTAAEAHDPHLAHHFDSMSQQRSAGKLGLWLFLATEILMFGGLFCGYTVYRMNHPEIFLYAHQFLDATLGGINTVVLILSSFTMAYAVRCAQVGDQKMLKLCLGLTILGGFGFMGIKYVEYKHKWEHGLLWGKRYESQEAPVAEEATPEAEVAKAPEPEKPAADAPAAGAEAAPPATSEKSTIPLGARGPAGLLSSEVIAARHVEESAPRNVHLFFGIYFVMTGLHGLHVVVGIGLLGWLWMRARRGDFGPKNFAAVDLGGLYWHLVDVIWIFLFPLLYLIH